MANSTDHQKIGLQTSATFSQSYWGVGFSETAVQTIPPARSNLWMFNLPNVEPINGDLSIVVGQFFNALGELWTQMKDSNARHKKRTMHARIAQILAVAARQFDLPDGHDAWLAIMSLYVASIQSKFTDLRKQNGLVLRSLAVAIVRKAHGRVADHKGKPLTKNAIREIVFQSISTHCISLFAHTKIGDARQIAQWEKKRLFITDGFEGLDFPSNEGLFRVFIDQHFSKLALVFEHSTSD